MSRATEGAIDGTMFIYGCSLFSHNEINSQMAHLAFKLYIYYYFTGFPIVYESLRTITLAFRYKLQLKN